MENTEGKKQWSLVRSSLNYLSITLHQRLLCSVYGWYPLIQPCIIGLGFGMVFICYIIMEWKKKYSLIIVLWRRYFHYPDWEFSAQCEKLFLWMVYYIKCYRIRYKSAHYQRKYVSLPSILPDGMLFCFSGMEFALNDVQPYKLSYNNSVRFQENIKTKYSLMPLSSSK